MRSTLLPHTLSLLPSASSAQGCGWPAPKLAHKKHRRASIIVRARPRKATFVLEPDAADKELIQDLGAEEDKPRKRTRTTKAKTITAVDAEQDVAAQAVATAAADEKPRRRGRPTKAATATSPGAGDSVAAQEAAAAAVAESDDKPRRRGRASKAKTVNAAEPAQDAVQDVAQDEAATQDIAAAEGAAAARSVAEDRTAALPVQLSAADRDEDNPRRFPFHRMLQQAAIKGDVDTAENALAQLQEAGFAPGPRAYHVLLFAYVKANDAMGALQVAQRAAAEEITLLPESYCVLIHAFVTQTPPDLQSATSVLLSMQAAQQRPDLGWLMLTKQMFRKGLGAEAMELVQQGLENGYLVDSDLYKYVIRHLCDSGDRSSAEELLASMGRGGLTPTPAHYNPVIKTMAMEGDAAGAQALIAAVDPNADSYNALLEGMVRHMRPREESVQHQFEAVRGTMVAAGVMPNRYTYKHICEGCIKLGDADLSLAAFSNMRKAAAVAGSRLLDPNYLAGLLVLLADDDRPADLANTLSSLVDDECKIPPQAMAPNDGGLSIITQWIPAHLDHMQARASGLSPLAGADGQANLRVIDDVYIGMGDCAVDEYGEFLPVPRMTLGALRAECKARGAVTDGLKRLELVMLVKQSRAALPQHLLEAQRRLAEEKRQMLKSQAIARGEPVAPEKKGRGGPRKSAPSYRHSKLKSFRDGKLVEVKEIVEEVAEQGYETVRVKSADQYDDDYLDSERDAEREGGMDDLALTMDSGVDEGVREIIDMGESRDILGLPDDDNDNDDDDEDEFSSDKVSLRRLLAQEADDEDVTVGYFDTRADNATAGMTIAVSLLKAVEMLGGRPTAGDLVMLVQGCEAESNAAACAEVAARLHHLSRLGYRDSDVTAMYASLANVCLANTAIEQAEAVVTAAERNSYSLPQSIYDRLQRSEATAPVSDKAKRTDVLDTADEDIDDIYGEDEEEPAEGGSSTAVVQYKRPVFGSAQDVEVVTDEDIVLGLGGDAAGVDVANDQPLDDSDPSDLGFQLSTDLDAYSAILSAMDPDSDLLEDEVQEIVELHTPLDSFGITAYAEQLDPSVLLPEGVEDAGEEGEEGEEEQDAADEDGEEGMLAEELDEDEDAEVLDEDDVALLTNDVADSDGDDEDEAAAAGSSSLVALSRNGGVRVSGAAVQRFYETGELELPELQPLDDSRLAEIEAVLLQRYGDSEDLRPGGSSGTLVSAAAASAQAQEEGDWTVEELQRMFQAYEEEPSQPQQPAVLMMSRGAAAKHAAESALDGEADEDIEQGFDDEYEAGWGQDADDFDDWGSSADSGSRQLRRSDAMRRRY